MCAYCDEAHQAFNCTLTAQQRWDAAKQKRLCFNCLRPDHSSKNCKSQKKCGKCGRFHHTTLCNPRGQKNNPEGKVQATKNNDKDNHKSVEKAKDNGSTESTVKTCLVNSGPILLQTASTWAMGTQRNRKVHVLLDGGSQRSFVTESLVNTLDFPIEGYQNLSLTPFGSEKAKQQRYEVVSVLLRTRDERQLSLKAIVVPQITGSVHRAQIPEQVLDDFGDLPWAEDYASSDEKMKVDILIGLDHIWDVICGPIKRITNGSTAMDTVFGWILSGNLPVVSDADTGAYLVNKLTVNQDKCLESFWNLESIGITDQDTECIDSEAEVVNQLFKQGIKYKDQRYFVDFPHKTNIDALPTNKDLVNQRFVPMVKRLEKDPSLLKEYDRIIQEQLERNFIERVPTCANSTNYIHYISHHPVIKSTSATTKVRIVYNASARADKHSPSLNDVLYKGPDLMGDLFGILLRFRKGPIGISSDIEKAFLMVGLNESQRDLTRFLWLKDDNNPNCGYTEFRFSRVPFGVISSPYLLNQTVQYHLEKIHSSVSRLLQDAFYMDNCVISISGPKEALEFYKEAKDIFNSAGMNLREWITNDASLRSSIPKKDRPTSSENLKVLGISWDPFKDTISTNPKLPEFRNPPEYSKRAVLQAISTVFDPHGWFTPVTIKGKILMQDIWKQKMDWDQILPEVVQLEAQSILENMQAIKHIKLSRYLNLDMDKAIDLHTFVDASPKAYVAATYAVQRTKEGVKIVFLCSKARVAPLKQQTLPRLELLGILVGTRISSYIKSAIQMQVESLHIWSDSQIALAWIGSEKVIKPFVMNRVKEIRKLDCTFHYVPTKDNPADLATRGISAQRLNESQLWWNGPEWLGQRNKPKMAKLDQKIVDTSEYYEEVKTNILQTDLTTSEHVSIWPMNAIDIERFSSLSKLVRTTAWCLRFANKGSKIDKNPEFLHADEIIKAEQHWIKAVQHKAFEPEIKLLLTNKRNGLINQLNLFLDTDGVIRCKGRLENMICNQESKCPKLLPKNHAFYKADNPKLSQKISSRGTQADSRYDTIGVLDH